MDIFDKKNENWYRIKRNIFGNLVLEKIIYTQMRRCPTESDLVFDDVEGLLKVIPSIEPRTPE